MKLTNKQKREMVRKDYDAISDVYIKNCSELDFYLPYVNEFMKNLKRKSILDLGCGQGVFANYFHENGYFSEGIDFSSNLLEYAKRNYPYINFIHYDFCDFDTTKKYDGIFIKNVLFHVPENDIKKLFIKLNDWLEIDGKICILMEIPKQEGEQILAEEFDENLKVYYNYMKPEKVTSLLKEAGFEIDKCETVTNNENATIYAYGLMFILATKK